MGRSGEEKSSIEWGLTPFDFEHTCRHCEFSLLGEAFAPACHRGKRAKSSVIDIPFLFNADTHRCEEFKAILKCGVTEYERKK